MFISQDIEFDSLSTVGLYKCSSTCIAQMRASNIGRLLSDGYNVQAQSVNE